MNANKAGVKAKQAAEAVVERSQTLFRGRVFSVTRDTVREPGGVRVTRDVVRHAGSAVILPRRDDGSILLVRQFRLPARRHLWELAAGRLDAGEAPLDAARRELVEETGLSATRWSLLGQFFPSPGYVDERMFVYLAEDLRRGRARPEEDERIQKRWFKLERIVSMIRSGAIADGKTLAGVLYLQQTRKRG